MNSRKNTRRQLFLLRTCRPRRDAVKLARIIADRLAKHRKLRGTIVVMDEHGDPVCEIPVASEH
jgi:hypothetical protein